MVIKIIKYEELTENNKKHIIRLLDVFVKRQRIKFVAEDDIKRVMGESNNTLVVADEDEKIVGMTLLIEANVFAAKVGFIEEVSVAEEYKGKGIASLIMEKVISIAREKKIDYLKLDTNVKNPSNHLYQKFNFVRKDDNLYKLTI